MGGCRCSYRNCTVRSDGVTHMFHYPVFEKIRCHQWLTNAHKLEFLNLKVSQLKNRVICQHHFKDECFMNFKKDKLTFHAVPTLDGPYCDSSQYNTNSSDLLKKYPISLEDIENEYLTLTDKQANFSVKYGDFLTNFDMMDIDPVNNVNNEEEVVTKKSTKQGVKSQPIQFNKMLQHNNQNELLTADIKPKSKSPSVNTISLDVQPVQLQLCSRNQNGNESNQYIISSANPCITNNLYLNNAKTAGESKVKVLSVKKISEPIKLTGSFKKLSPSLTIKVPERKYKTETTEVKQLEKKSNNNETSLTTDSHDIAIVMQAIEESKSALNQNLQISDNYNKNSLLSKVETPTKTNKIPSTNSFCKNKLSPERMAAINEKRKFNMKLREIIESCLDNIEKQHKNDEEQKQYSKVQEPTSTQVGTFLAEEPELPSLQEYTIACLEARMEKMESLLLSKIEQNSQRIMDLKSTINSTNKSSKSTQTARNEEAHKMQLYKEISHYLSPDINSLMYEELFINKFAPKTQSSSPLNKRRRKK